jgi:hypothetical protein
LLPSLFLLAWTWLHLISSSGSEWPPSCIIWPHVYPTHFNPEDGGSMLHWSADIHLPYCYWCHNLPDPHPYLTPLTSTLKLDAVCSSKMLVFHNSIITGITAHFYCFHLCNMNWIWRLLTAVPSGINN